MKNVALLSIALLSLFSVVGCSTPAYTARERGNQIARNMGIEWQQVQDDIDSIALLRPAGTMTKWHVTP